MITLEVYESRQTGKRFVLAGIKVAQKEVRYQCYEDVLESVTLAEVDEHGVLSIEFTVEAKWFNKNFFKVGRIQARIRS